MDDRRRFYMGMCLHMPSCPARSSTVSAVCNMATACDVECDGTPEQLLPFASRGSAIVWC